MKFKFIAPANLAALQASAENWDALIAAATEAGITDAASLDATTLLQRITEPDAEQSEQISKLTAAISTRDATIASLQTRITELEKEIGKKPGATPAQAIAESDPPPANSTNELGCLSGKESFVESLDLLKSWL